MIESHETEIGGNRYRFLPLQLKPARRMLNLILKRIAPGVADGIRGLKEAKSDVLDTEVKNEVTALVAVLPALSASLGGIVEGLGLALDPKFHEEMIATFFPRVTVNMDGDWPKLTSDRCADFFATSLLSETKVLLWCLKVQYADFFELWSVAKSSLASFQAEMKQRLSTSPSASTGTPSESPQANDMETV